MSTTPRTLYVHQLSPGGKTSPVLYIAETVGWSSDELGLVAFNLFRFQMAQRWHCTEAPTVIYSFIKHDAGVTKNIEFVSDPKTTPGTGIARLNEILHSALEEKTHATFTVAPDKQPGKVLTDPIDLSGLRVFYAPMPAIKSTSVNK